MIHSVDEDDLPLQVVQRARRCQSSESPTDYDDRISALLVHSRFSITLTVKGITAGVSLNASSLHEHNGATREPPSSGKARALAMIHLAGVALHHHTFLSETNASYLPFTSHPTFTHIYCAGKRSQV